MSTPYNKNLKMKQQKHGSRRKRWVLAVAAVIILATGGCLVFRHYHHKKIIAVTASQDTKGEGTTATTPSNTTGNAGGTTNSSSTSSNTSGSQPGDNKANSGGTTPAPTAKLITPTGDFVSAHHLSASGSPAPINSTCTTTPGATCQIIFTKDGVTKSLPAQITDRGGSTYWNGWKLQDYGLTAGEWHIQAKATLGSQVATADDAMALDVQP